MRERGDNVLAVVAVLSLFFSPSIYSILRSIQSCVSPLFLNPLFLPRKTPGASSHSRQDVKTSIA